MLSECKKSRPEDTYNFYFFCKFLAEIDISDSEENFFRLYYVDSLKLGMFHNLSHCTLNIYEDKRFVS